MEKIDSWSDWLIEYHDVETLLTCVFPHVSIQVAEWDKLMMAQLTLILFLS